MNISSSANKFSINDTLGWIVVKKGYIKLFYLNQEIKFRQLPKKIWGGLLRPESRGQQLDSQLLSFRQIVSVHHLSHQLQFESITVIQSILTGRSTIWLSVSQFHYITWTVIWVLFLVSFSQLNSVFQCHLVDFHQRSISWLSVTWV